LEAGQSSRRNNINLKWHYAPAINWNQRAVLMHTPSGRSARDNITKWQPVNVDGIPCNAKHGGIFGRNDWGKPCHTVLMSSNTISGDWTIHPGRPLSGGTYSDARYFTILELLRITGLPDSYEIPTWASDKLIRDVIGECFVPRHVERLMTTLPR
jgi:DNA (cytosine-5)-methyltransferase 1